MSRLFYFTGPVRSGKSRRAVEFAQSWGAGVVFVATYRPMPGDAEMAERVSRHRAERPAAWRTLEAPCDVAAALAALTPPPSGVVLDCLTLWTGDHFAETDEQILAAWRDQLTRFRAAPWPIVIVGNEIGWAPVPADPALRRYRDLIGTLAQLTTAAADEVWLHVAGCPLRLK